MQLLLMLVSVNVYQFAMHSKEAQCLDFIKVLVLLLADCNAYCTMLCCAVPVGCKGL
jgi:hypothetical protein